MNGTSIFGVRRVWLAAMALLVAALAFAAFAVLEAGACQVVEDPLQPARAVVVLGGKVPFRAMEAAKLYKQAV